MTSQNERPTVPTGEQVNWVLETQRLKLREFLPSDARMLFELNVDPKVLEHTGDQPFESEKAAANFIKNYTAYAESGFGRWTVCLKSAGMRGIGWCGLKRHTDGLVDLGFRFFQSSWNNGYATEAASACLRYGFEKLDLDQIIGRTARMNHASIRVLEKIGMQYLKAESITGIPDALVFKIERAK